ncbi:MAG: substrate-binding domain-containing protein [Gammaproteobacteria bacterium]|nr:substrate-binding domain-containing protein [Gammaproteobacteria bacterium]
MNTSVKNVPAATDVARLAGVSQSAVSRAFTSGASISSKTRSKVMAAAEELGYRPNQLARSLLRGRSQLIGVVLGNMENPFFPLALETLSKQLNAQGHKTLVFTNEANQQADTSIEDMLNYRVDALILMATTLSSSLAEQCQAAGIPVVFVNRISHAMCCSSVTSDNEHGARLIAQHLVDAGYQRIAFMAGIETSSTSRDREAAFTDALIAMGREKPMRVVGHFNRTGAMQAMRQLLKQAQRPDAVFCANDHMAMAATDVARYEYALTPGKDIGIAGFDDIPHAHWPGYDITTYSQPLDALISQTVERVLSQSNQYDAIHTVVKGNLIMRSSTSPTN